ncbi:unnamed protein product [Citrullus colocynthis]|uniref:Uncharacterized protein n=1 Tax=Citrullus colocynthis TaxID=252529 RepID=A0ABP0YKV4_9ROSI
MVVGVGFANRGIDHMSVDINVGGSSFSRQQQRLPEASMVSFVPSESGNMRSFVFALSDNTRLVWSPLRRLFSSNSSRQPPLDLTWI